MKTKKFFGLMAACAAVLACAPAAQAQSEGEGVTFGIRAGLNLSNAAMNDDVLDGADTKMKAGFQVGVIADIPVIKRNLYVQPGLYFSTKGVKLEENYSEIESNYSWEETSEVSVNAMYLEIPINVSWRHNFTDALQLQVYTGPYFAFGVGGKTKTSWGYSESDGYSYSEEYKTNTFGYDEEAEKDEDAGFGLGRFDFGWGIGAGLAIQKFYVGIQYQFGLTNTLKGDNWKATDDWDPSAKNRNLSISVGYNF